MLFLKLIIDRATIVTNASISVIVGKLMQLEERMTDFDSDIKAFNTFVNNELRNYRANSLTEFDSQVLYQQLVKAYKKAQDKDFVDMIKRKDEQHEDGSAPLTPALLMTHALRKFEIRSELHEWKEQTLEQKEIVALTSQLKSLQSPKKKWPGDKTPEDKTPPKLKKGDYKNKNSQNKGKKFEPPPWMKKAPTDGKGTMQQAGKQYWWCPAHQLWQRHKPEDCRKRQEMEKQGKNTTAPLTDDKTTGTIRINTNLIAIAEEASALDYDL